MISKIDQLFGSKTRVKLLTKLLLNPEKTFYMRKLSRELHVTYSMIRKEAKNLASLGIINENKQGKVTLISINKSLPYFNDLKNLIVKTSGIGDLLKDVFSKLSGIDYALVYGSMASGEESTSSDVDLLIVGQSSEEEILKIVGVIEEEVEREVNYVLWTKEDFMQRVKSKHHLLVDIAEKPVIMLVGDENEFRRTVKKPNHRTNKA
jgi:predicted nucleotidyltransferase